MHHRPQVQNMTREGVYAHLLSLPSLSAHGPVPNSPGNFYVDLVSESEAGGAAAPVVARLVFFDSREDNVDLSINDEQLLWFANVTASLPAVPTLAFYHIPLLEYQTAVAAHVPVSGGVREKICADKPNPKVFAALKAGGVVAGFCGHDHTNDFCVEWQGVQLCYEGSPGFGGYGYCGPFKKKCVERRARVTELHLSVGDEDTSSSSTLAAIRSWKRVDGGGATAGAKIDDEELWTAAATTTRLVEHGKSTSRPQLRQPVSEDLLNGLPRRKQGV